VRVGPSRSNFFERLSCEPALEAGKQLKNGDPLTLA
jgi:hypothetical protein